MGVELVRLLQVAREDRNHLVKNMRVHLRKVLLTALHEVVLMKTREVFNQICNLLTTDHRFLLISFNKVNSCTCQLCSEAFFQSFLLFKAAIW